jgi:hypothetical protein
MGRLRVPHIGAELPEGIVPAIDAVPRRVERMVDDTTVFLFKIK